MVEIISTCSLTGLGSRSLVFVVLNLNLSQGMDESKISLHTNIRAYIGSVD